MGWEQLLVIIGTNAALFFWARAESRADTRMMLGMIQGIQDEIKSFHGRLCTIEEWINKE